MCVYCNLQAWCSTLKTFIKTHRERQAHLRNESVGYHRSNYKKPQCSYAPLRKTQIRETHKEKKITKGLSTKLIYKLKSNTFY